MHAYIFGRQMNHPRVAMKFRWQNSRIFQGSCHDFKGCHNSTERLRFHGQTLGLVTCNGLVCRLVVPIWKKLSGKSFHTQNSRITRIIFNIQGCFKNLPKLPLIFKDFSWISRTCLKFKDFIKDVATQQPLCIVWFLCFHLLLFSFDK